MAIFLVHFNRFGFKVVARLKEVVSGEVVEETVVIRTLPIFMELSTLSCKAQTTSAEYSIPPDSLKDSKETA